MTLIKPKPRREQLSNRGEAALLFSAGQHRLAIAASVLQEIRHGRRQDASRLETVPTVSAGTILETPLTHGEGLLILRETQVAVRVDNMECMIEIRALHPLPHAFVGRERRWYRGLVLLGEDVIPLVNPDAFVGESGPALPSDACSKEIQPVDLPPEVRKIAAGSCQTFVVFPLGEKRFALSVDVVSEICRPARMQTFPHTTPGLPGVVVHRGLILPVWDVASLLLWHEARPLKFHLIARRMLPQGEEWTAIPISGECRRVQTEITPAENDAPPYVQGVLYPGDEDVECLDLEKLAQSQRAEISLQPAAELSEMQP